MKSDYRTPIGRQLRVKGTVYVIDKETGKMAEKNPRANAGPPSSCPGPDTPISFQAMQICLTRVGDRESFLRYFQSKKPRVPLWMLKQVFRLVKEWTDHCKDVHRIP
jgi:hypothetical protein